MDLHNKYKEKLVILQSIEIKSKKTRVVTFSPADILVDI